MNTPFWSFHLCFQREGKMTFLCLCLVTGDHSCSRRAWDRPEGPALIPAPHGHITAALGQLLSLPMGSCCANLLQKWLVWCFCCVWERKKAFCVIAPEWQNVSNIFKDLRQWGENLFRWDKTNAAPTQSGNAVYTKCLHVFILITME